MPTEVEFHTGIAEPLGFACRLLRKAYRKGARVVVIGPAPVITRLDQALWTFDERDFVPHLRCTPSGPRPALAARTPIWLSDAAEPPPASPPIVLNLGTEAVPSPTRFDRIIEIVSTEADDVQAGRQRWRTYKGLGLPLKQHVAGAESG